MIESRSESRANERVVQGSPTAVGDEEGSCFGAIGSLFHIAEPGSGRASGQEDWGSRGKDGGSLVKTWGVKTNARTLQLAKQKNLQGAFRSEKNWHTTYS